MKKYLSLRIKGIEFEGLDKWGIWQSIAKISSTNGGIYSDDDIEKIRFAINAYIDFAKDMLTKLEKSEKK